MSRQKLYLVKREVLAKSVREALKKPGVVYEVSLASEKEWPEESTKVNGFESKK